MAKLIEEEPPRLMLNTIVDLKVKGMNVVNTVLVFVMLCVSHKHQLLMAKIL